MIKKTPWDTLRMNLQRILWKIKCFFTKGDCNDKIDCPFEGHDSVMKAMEDDKWKPPRILK